jgi:membrane-associated phospholipid phosphatase
VTQTIDPNAGRNSTIRLTLAMSFAVVDPLMTGFRSGWRSAAVDALMYGESLSTTTFVTEVTKIAVRRPRPIDYKDPGSSDTNAVLSYFSGHASSTASVTATATYLAFVRSPGTARPWITLGVGTLPTGFVSYERVRSGAHFPTDVVAGSMAGAAIGVLIPRPAAPFGGPGDRFEPDLPTWRPEVPHAPIPLDRLVPGPDLVRRPPCWGLWPARGEEPEPGWRSAQRRRRGHGQGAEPPRRRSGGRGRGRGRSHSARRSCRSPG